MKILILANSADFLYNFKKELLCRLVADGHEVAVSCPAPDAAQAWKGERLKSAGCRFIETAVDRRGANPFKDRGLLKRYKKIISEEKPDIVLSYTVKCNIYGGMATKKAGVTYFANVTGLGTAFQRKLLRKLVVSLYKRALKKVRKVFFENAANADAFINSKIIPREKAVLLNGSGVNLAEFQYEPPQRGNTQKDIQSKQGKKTSQNEAAEFAQEKPINLLFVGRVMREKGIGEFLCAAERAKAENLPASFSIVGNCEEDYKDKLAALQENGAIKYFGFQSDVKTFYRQCDCVVLPSYHEGMSNTLLEGAATGRPLIVSDIPGCREAVARQSENDSENDAKNSIELGSGGGLGEVVGANGYLVKPKDGADLYDKIKAFCALSAAQREAMGRASREHMEKNFDREKAIETTVAAITEAY